MADFRRRSKPNEKNASLDFFFFIKCFIESRRYKKKAVLPGLLITYQRK
jgi:hypothetical protein